MFLDGLGLLCFEAWTRAIELLFVVVVDATSYALGNSVRDAAVRCVAQHSS